MQLPGNERMPHAFWPRPLSQFVAMLVLSVFVPILLLGAALVWRVGLLDQEQANQQALQVAQSVSANIDREIDGSIASLLALSTSEALKHGNLEEFYNQARQAMSYRKLHVLLRTPDGQQVLNTRVPFAASIPHQELTVTDRQLIADRTPVVSNLVIGAVMKSWVVGLSVPVIHDDKIAYILALSLEPEHFRSILMQAVPTAGWVIALSDRTGRSIARTIEHDQHVGREMDPDARARSNGTQGVHRTPSPNDVEVVRGYVWSKNSGWLVAAFIPSSVVDAPLNSLWRLLALTAVGVMGLVLPVAYFLTRQITGPIGVAVAAAERLGRGEDVVATSSVMREANDLSDALERASRDLQARSQELRDSQVRYRSVFEQSAVGFKLVAPDGSLIGVNDRLCRLLGYTREECMAKTFKALTHPDDWNTEAKFIDAMMKGETPNYELEKRLIMKSGDPVWVRITSAVVRDVDGKALYRTSVIEDVTERRKARESSSRLAAIVQASPDAMFSTCLAGNIETWNPGGTKLFGYASEDIIGKPVAILAPLTPPSKFADNLAAIQRGEVLRSDVKWKHKDGTLIDVAVSAAPIRTNNQISSISLTAEDIRDRKRREDHILLLNRELAHRVKNTLAVIQSISNQTMRSTPDPKVFRIAFQGRLQALSSANDLLMQTSWDGSELKDFLDRQLAPLMPRGSAQLSKDGPPVVVPAELTVHLGLALHELGTNALKYGAWSVPGGHVRLTWEVQHVSDSDAARLLLTWCEQGGPAVTTPVRTGFGTSLIEKGIPDAIVARRFLPDGLICTINVALPVSHPIYLG